MGSSFRDKAGNRASLYRERIAAKQAEGDSKGALLEANRWLRAELEKVRKQRSHDAPGVDADVTEKLAQLAEVIPFYKPARKE